MTDAPARTAVPRAVLAAAAVVGAGAVALLFLERDRTAAAGFDEASLFGGTDRAHGFLTGGIGWALETTRGELRRPLFWAPASLAGSLATIHLVATLLHGAAFAALAGLAARVAAGRDARASLGTIAVGSAFAAAWALHPARVEAVADGTALGAPLGSLLMCLAAAAWCRAQTTSSRPQATSLAASALIAAALLADPTLCFAPVAFVALRAWLRRDGPEALPGAGGSLVPAGLAAAAVLVAGLACREAGGGAPLLAAALAAASAVVRPLRSLVWPAGLHPAYDPPPGFPETVAPSLWIDAVTAAAMVAACVVLVRRRHGLGYGLAASLSLVAGSIVLRRSPAGSDVDGYAATMPLFVAGAVAVTRVSARPRNAVAIGVAAVAAALWIVVTHPFVSAWSDEAALSRRVAEIDPTNERAIVAQGDAARRSGARVSDLVHRYEAALEPGDWRPYVHARLGAALLETGDPAAARRHLARAVEIAPWIPEARFDLGALELREGHGDAAREHLEAAARLDADSAEVWRLLAQARDAVGDRAAAAAAIGRAARLAPEDARIADDLRRLAR